MANTSYDQAFAYGRQAANSRGQHAQMLSDEEHEQALNDHNTAIKNIQGQLATATPNTPEYDNLQKQLGDTLESRTQLFHPSVAGPARLANFLRDKLGVNPPATPQVSAQTPAGAPTSLPGTASSMGVAQTVPGAAAGPTVSTPAQGKAQLDTAMRGVPPTPPNELTEFGKKLKAAIPSMSDEDVANAQKIHAGIAPKPTTPKAVVWKPNGVPYLNQDGNWYQREINPDGDIRNQVMPSGYQQAKKDPTSKDAVMRAEYARSIGKKPEEMTWEDETNMQQALKNANSPYRTGGSFKNVTQKDGSIVSVWSPTSSHATYGDGSTGPKATNTGVKLSGPAPTNDPQITNPRGLVKPGNIPLNNRPVVANDDGSHSTEFSASFQDDDGREVLVPTIVGGKFLTPDGKKPPEGSDEEEEMFQRAWEHYKDTGENLGIFDNETNATTYANALHNRNEALIPDNTTSPTAGQLKKRAAAALETAKNPPGPTVKAPKTAKPAAAPATPPTVTAKPVGVASPGAVVGGKETPAETKADEDVTAALKLDQLANQTAQSNEPGQQKQLALALIKGMAGRVNMQEYAIYTKGYGVENSVDGLIKGISSGRLAPGIVDQLVKDAHANLSAARYARDHFMDKQQTVNMKAPDGTVRPVPSDQVEHYKSKGATVVP